MNDLIHLFLCADILVDHRIEIISLINPLFRTQEPCLYVVLQYHFQGLTMLFIHGKQKAWKHDNDHEKRGRTCSDCILGQKEQRQTNQCSCSEADHLTLGQVEEKFCFDLCQVFGYGYIGHTFTSCLRTGAGQLIAVWFGIRLPTMLRLFCRLGVRFLSFFFCFRFVVSCILVTCLLMCIEYGFRNAAGLEQGEAEQDGISDTGPQGSTDITADCYGLHKHRIDADTNHNEERLKTKREQ